MKINKLMLAMAVAASAFISCNKQETTPVVNDNMGNKSIVLNIANVLPGTKTPGTSIANQTQVTLNDYQIFFVDGNGTFYSPKDATASNAEVDTYFTVQPDKPLTHQFHFLDNNVTRVIVVGNMGETFKPADETALWNALANVAVEDQQDEDALILYGSDSNLETTADHVVSEDQHPKPVYKAVVNLMPAVARFEVTGYEYAQAKEKVKDPETGVETETGNLLPREYKQVVINNQSLIGFYGTASLESTGETNWTVTPGALAKPLETYTWNNVYQDYFSKLTPTDKDAWYYDATAYTLTGETQEAATWKAAATSVTGEGEEAVNNNCYAYHVYPSTVEEKENVVPSFIFQITATDANGIVTPMYLQTKGFTDIDEIAAGNVYQMNVKFDDSVLKAAEKCIDVEIKVHKWVVSVVTPEF